MDAYPFIEVSKACSDVAQMETFWRDMFDAEVIFRGNMMGQPFTRLLACGITLVFREDPEFRAPPGPGEEFMFREHLGLRVRDLQAAIAALEAKGANFVLTPEKVRQFQQMKKDDGRKFLETTYVAPPLTPERIAGGEFKIDVAILVGPDNLWIELNQIREGSRRTPTGFRTVEGDARHRLPLTAWAFRLRASVGGWPGQVWDAKRPASC